MTNNRQTGTIGEDMAIQFLENNDYAIIERNYRCRIGEIDIIAENEGYLVFIEVKYRHSANKGNPFDSITLKKQSTIRKVAQYFMLCHNYDENMKCRFDAVGILNNEITLIKNAF